MLLRRNNTLFYIAANDPGAVFNKCFLNGGRGESEN
jgi:hypothetical protein